MTKGHVSRIIAAKLIVKGYDDDPKKYHPSRQWCNNLMRFMKSNPRSGSFVKSVEDVQEELRTIATAFLETAEEIGMK